MTNLLKDTRTMIMAAGEGTRLRPLTYFVPKPLVPVVNRPATDWLINHLQMQGITEIAMNVCMHTEKVIAHYGDGSKFNVSLRYSREENLLGTAGGVKKLQSFLAKGTSLILSGDGLTDMDFEKLLQFHRKNKALATIVLKPVQQRFEYGVVLCDNDFRITNFVEKPHWGDVFANTVNTGIYVLEPEVFDFIPKDKFYDFGHQLWPELLKTGQPLYGYTMAEAWYDVGNLQEYRNVHHAILSGEIHLTPNGKEVKPGLWVEGGAGIVDGLNIETPAAIGKNCHIASSARIKKFSVLGNDVEIGENTKIEESILWEGVKVGQGTRLFNCIVRSGVNVPSGMVIHNAVLV